MCVGNKQGSECPLPPTKVSVIHWVSWNISCGRGGCCTPIEAQPGILWYYFCPMMAHSQGSCSHGTNRACWDGGRFQKALWTKDNGDASATF